MAGSNEQDPTTGEPFNERREGEIIRFPQSRVPLQAADSQ